MTNPMRAPTCDATVFVRDDRMGGWTNHCELAPGHNGPHSHALTACEPRAEMIWFSEPDVSGSEVS